MILPQHPRVDNKLTWNKTGGVFQISLTDTRTQNSLVFYYGIIKNIMCFLKSYDKINQHLGVNCLNSNY